MDNAFRYLRKTATLVMAFLLVLTSVPLLFTPLQVEAAGTWNKLTDSEFSELHNNLRGFLTIEDQYFVFYDNSNDLPVYELGEDSNLLRLNVDKFGEENNIEIIEMVYAGALYALVMNTEDGNKIYKHIAEEIWTVVELDVEFAEDVLEIIGIGNLGETLYVAMLMDIGDSDTEVQIYEYDGAEWTAVGDIPANLGAQTSDLRDLLFYEHGSGLYIAARNGEDGTIIAGYFNDYGYEDLGSFSENGASPTSIAMHNNNNTYIANNDGYVYQYLGAGDWTIIGDPGLGSGDVTTIHLVSLAGELYAAGTNYYETAELYRLHNDDWKLIETRIDDDDYLAYYTDVIAFDGKLYMGVAENSEGPRYASLYEYTPGPDFDNLVHNSDLDYDDGCAGPIPLGFEFDFFGETFDELYINTNGTVTFTECYSGYGNVDLTDPENEPGRVTENTIYAFWNDLDSEPFRNILYQVQGEEEGSRKFIVQWTNYYFNSDSYFAEDLEGLPSGTISLILDEQTGEVTMQYGSIRNGNLGRGKFATIAMAKNEEVYVQFSYNEVVLNHMSVINFVPDGEGSYEFNEETEFEDEYFLIESTTPNRPALFTPTNNATNVSVTPTISWQGDEDYDYYNLFISTDPYFEQGYGDYDYEENVPVNSIVFAAYRISDEQVDLSEVVMDSYGNLSEGTKYYWFVQGVIENEISQVTATQVFTTEGEADSDSDGATDPVENAAPNDGDGNNDGVDDAQQANVTSFINSLTGKYVVLETTCNINSELSMLDEEEVANKDAAFNYPVGLLDMRLECAEGAIADINIYYYGDYNAELFVARKYNLTTNTYFTIPDATITNTSIGGQNVLKLSYKVEDGGQLDDDGEVNGIIIDPAGPGLNTAGVPQTGLGGTER